MEIRNPKVGDVIICDGWGKSHCAEPLLADDGYKDSSFPGCQFRVPLRGGQYMVAVNVYVTGRTLQRPFGVYGGWWVRTKIEFVGDGEPSVFESGWIRFLD